jgi:acyl-CoA dehydrogenase
MHSVLEHDDSETQAMTYLVHRFATKEIAPHVAAWEEAGMFPRELYRRAADLGLLAVGYPEDLGGTPATQRMKNALTLPLARYGASGGVFASLFSHNIGLPPLAP